MTDPNDNTSVDTMVDIEKESYPQSPEDRVHPAAAAGTPAAEESEKQSDEATDGVDEGPGDGNENALDKGNSGGAELARVPSQAQKLGKKKVIVIMGALCVRLFSECAQDVADSASLVGSIPRRAGYGTYPVEQLARLGVKLMRMYIPDNRVDCPAHHGRRVPCVRGWLFLDGLVISAGQRGLHSTLGKTE